jgi:hypothetical protein
MSIDDEIRRMRAFEIMCQLRDDYPEWSKAKIFEEWCRRCIDEDLLDEIERTAAMVKRESN